MKSLVVASLEIICLVAVSGLFGCSRRQQPGAGRNHPCLAWHAVRLQALDMHLDGMRSIATNEPYHLWKLIEAGRESAPLLLLLLGDHTPTDIEYRGTLAFGRSVWTVGDIRVRAATVGDIADYALRMIYGTDPGYRSYKDPEEREEAVRKWERIVFPDKASESR